MPFADLGLEAELLRAISVQGYTQPTPIQAQAIPEILQGSDVLAGAQTGTGKTAAFALPILQLLRAPSGHKMPRALVLTPTRELAAQVGESFNTYGQHVKLRTAIVFGGVGIQPQKDAMRRGLDIIVATPGRLLDHLGQGTVDLSSIEILVLDEADRMLDMGFIHDIKKVLARLPKQRQNLLFSATYSNDIKRLADGLLNHPTLIEIARKNVAADTVQQHVYHVEKSAKRDLLIHAINDGQWHQVLVFSRTKHGANRLAEQLNRSNIQAAAIHGNKSQSARTKALAGFKNGHVRVLVATDIAARGLDIELLPHVVNYELPNVPEDYVHRIGRTGRAGETGAAISLVSRDERKLLQDIQRLLKRELPVLPLPEFARSATPEPSKPQQRKANNSGRSHNGQPGQPRNRNAANGNVAEGTGGQRKRRSPNRSRAA